MKDIKFFLRKRIKLLGGFSDYKKDTYKLFAIIPKDKYSINDQQLLKECSQRMIFTTTMIIWKIILS